MRDLPLSGLGTGTSIQSGGVKLVLWDQIFPLDEMQLTAMLSTCEAKKCRPSHTFV